MKTKSDILSPIAPYPNPFRRKDPFSFPRRISREEIFL